MLARLVLAAALLALLAAPARAQAPPPVGHVFVVLLENENYAETFGGAQAPYLARELASRGVVLRNYYGIGHLSLDNYIALLSGQGPNPATQSDCQQFTDFLGAPGLNGDGQALGTGCVYPATVKTLADQLTARGLSWKGYMEDMGTPCRHPALNAPDTTQQARAGDQYAARHNPFVYFHAIIDSPDCARNDVPLSALAPDLARIETTPNFSFITPNLCNDGHDSPCVDGRPGGLATADAWLRATIPQILASPAFLRDGLLIVTFDEAESEGSSQDASACCDEPQGPNTPNNGGPVPGPGGGRIGAVVVSPFVTPGSVDDTPYNHYALLRTFEDLFGVAHLGFAARPGLRPFGADVFARADTPAPPEPASPAAPCVADAVFARASVRAAGRRLRVGLALRGTEAADVTLRTLAGRTVARTPGRRADFTWTPRGLRDGYYVLRVAASGAVRRFGLRRSAGHFDVLPPYRFTSRCAAATLAAASPVFHARLRLTLQLRGADQVVVTVLRGGRTVARRTVRGAGRHRLTLRGLAPGVYRVRAAGAEITVRAGSAARRSRTRGST